MRDIPRESGDGRDQKESRKRIGGRNSSLENKRSIGEIAGEKVKTFCFWRPKPHQVLRAVRVVSLHPCSSLDIGGNEIVEAGCVKEAYGTTNNEFGSSKYDEDAQKKIAGEL